MVTRKQNILKKSVSTPLKDTAYYKAFKLHKPNLNISANRLKMQRFKNPGAVANKNTMANVGKGLKLAAKLR